MMVTRNIRVQRRHGEEQRQGVIEVVIDVEQIAISMARKAFWNKSKRTVDLGGLVSAKAHSVEEVSL